MKRLRKKILKYSIPAVIILLIAGGFVYSRYFNVPQVEYSTEKVVKGDIVQTVSETGTVKASEELNLQFLSSGKLEKLNKQVGDKVALGDVLAELDLRNARIQVKQAEAQLQGARANLSKLLNGATREEISIAENSAKQAEVAYENAKENLSKTKKTLDETADQAQKTYNDLLSNDADNITPQEQAVILAETTLKNLKSTLGQASEQQKESTLITADDKLVTGYIALDEVRKILDNDDFTNLFSVKNSVYKVQTSDGYDQALVVYQDAVSSVNAAKADMTDNKIKLAAEKVLDFLEVTSETLAFCYKALENSITSASFTQTSLDTYKTSINTKITTVNTAISTLKTSEQALNSAILNYHTKISDAEASLDQAEANYDNALKAAANALETAKKNREQQTAAAESQVKSAYEAWQTALAQLDKVKSPARTSDIAYVQSQVLSAEAALESAQKNLDDAVIKAPVSGVITKINYDVGEIVSSLNPVISMIGDNKEYIEIEISETDIENLELGDRTEITLDAFGDDIVMTGETYFIDPAQTVIQDVVYYQVKVKFDSKDSQSEEAAKALDKLKPGMTANVTIETAKQESVLIIPQRAVVDKDGKKYVRVLRGPNQVDEVEVALGLSGDEGKVEVLAGVEEGQDVVTFIKE